MFKDEVSSAIGNYVYRLIDPRNGETFYVGKGVGNRIFQHAQASAALLDGEEDDLSLKLGRIRKILDAGLEVVHVVHRHGIPADAVFEVEAALIDAFSGLANVQGGYGSAERGPMHAQEVVAKYGLPETHRAPNDRLLLINVNRSSESPESPSVYERVRYAWRIDVTRARQMQYVLAVRRGVVLDVFVAAAWKPALVANFPSLGDDQPKRWGFEGSPASEQVRKVYRNTRLPATVTHVQSPIRYWEREEATGEH